MKEQADKEKEATVTKKEKADVSGELTDVKEDATDLVDEATNAAEWGDLLNFGKKNEINWLK